MANCRVNCQADMLIGKYTDSDFTPEKLSTKRRDFELKHPRMLKRKVGRGIQEFEQTTQSC
ncbi:hypothetical protein [Vibrio diabolicus]|uniref:hypothetical protein n=1 Tax=Vibrio diabolicus TaxID=50719 RepID=UPI003B592577